MRCPSCGISNADSQRFCGACGAAISQSEAETVAGPASSRPAVHAAGFVPGQMFAGRYRMVGLLGKGGMGEVYRADDLKLGQPVALKFLPRDVEADADRLERFLTEVRLSLKVTHPNVCRVFDISHVDDRHFLSMEFVDGEDLASLLRRIGRLPEDKAVEIARQLCAGLAAAHDEGILHRDLKPANIMIDGRGRAKITDFGLAGASAGIAGREAQVGTPQYMAPEQFDGRELSVRSDLYSLGLVLYELFTGKAAFEGRDLNELAKLRSSAPTTPSAHVSALNPIVERAILRCLDPDPARRPESAERLAATLPGGDPLAMAIAAGETPSPEVVAQSGGGGELRPWVAGVCLAAVIAGLGVVWYTGGGISGIQNRVPLPKPPSELEVIARSALAAAGYSQRGAARASGFVYDTDYFAHVEETDKSRTRWNNLATVNPAPIWFWYREAPLTMSPMNLFGEVGMADPPVLSPGMTRLRLDPSGRLQELLAIPPDMPATPGPWAEPDWGPIFVAAGLIQDEWAPAESVWPPFRGAVDVRRAWTKGNVRLEATSFRGRPTWFRVVPEWRRPDVIAEPKPATLGSRLATVAFFAIPPLFILGAALIARRNIREGRGDRRGAFRLAAAYVCAGTTVELTRLNSDPSGWLTLFQNNVAIQVFWGVVVWLFYLAVEPYVRRFWPGTLVVWSRVVEGRFRDPMVGRHILLGALAGHVMTLVRSLPELDSAGSASILDISRMARTSNRLYVGALFSVLMDSLFLPVAFLLGLLVLRVIFRRSWLGYAVIYVIVPVAVLIGGQSWLAGLSTAIFITLILLVLTRLGLFAMLVQVAFSYWYALSLTTNPQSWFFPQSVVTMVLFGGLAIYAAWVSIGNQKVFKEAVLN